MGEKKNVKFTTASLERIKRKIALVKVMEEELSEINNTIGALSQYFDVYNSRFFEGSGVLLNLDEIKYGKKFYELHRRFLKTGAKINEKIDEATDKVNANLTKTQEALIKKYPRVMTFDDF